jgi:hypothetical protein|nr:hypothetical protein AUSP0033_00035 [uncultured phage]
MITTGDIETILFRDLKPYGFKMFRKNAITTGPVKEERLVVLCGSLDKATIWKIAFVNVNVYVPDIKGEANTKRLTEIERKLAVVSSVSAYDGTVYRYSVDSVSQEKDEALKCHFVNVSILFEVLNVKK